MQPAPNSGLRHITNLPLCHNYFLPFLLTFLTDRSTLILKPSFTQTLSLHSHLSLLRLISWNLTTQCLTVTGSGSIAQCGRLSQLGFTII